MAGADRLVDWSVSLAECAERLAFGAGEAMKTHPKKRLEKSEGIWEILRKGVRENKCEQQSGKEMALLGFSQNVEVETSLEPVSLRWTIGSWLVFLELATQAPWASDS